MGPSPLPVRSHLTFLRLLGHGAGGGNVAEAALGALRQEGPCWGQLQDELGPRVPLGEETKALCGRLPTPTQQGQFSQHKGCTVRLGLPAGGGPGAEGGPREWLLGPEVRRSGVAVEGGGVAEQGRGEHPGPRTSLVSPGLPPMSVQQRCGGVCHWQDPAARGWGCTWAPRRRCPEAGQGSQPVPSQSHLDLVVFLSISKLEGVGLHCAGHGGPAACLGCPPLFVQAPPGGPSLGQRPHPLARSIHLSVVAAALAATRDSSPVPAGALTSRHTGALSHCTGPCLGHWAQPGGYPIGAASTR